MQSTITVPVDIELTEITFRFRDDYHVNVSLEAHGRKLSEIAEGAPLFLREAFSRDGQFEFHVDIDTGKLRNWQRPTTDMISRDMPGGESATWLSIHSKVADEFGFEIKIQDGTIAAQEDGYTPVFLPGTDGDYLEFTIDLETGRIIDWEKRCNQRVMRRYFEEPHQYVTMHWPPRK